MSWAGTSFRPGQTVWSGDIHCVTRWSKFGMDWRGVDVKALIERARPTAEASHLMAHCYGGYTTNLPLTDVLEHPALIAHEADGAPLAPDHGGPARLLVPHLYLWKSAKWIQRLEIMEGDELGFWERNGYHHRGDPWREERYSVDDYVARTLRRQCPAGRTRLIRARRSASALGRIPVSFEPTRRSDLPPAWARRAGGPPRRAPRRRRRRSGRSCPPLR